MKDNIQKCIADIKDISLCLTDIKEWDRQRAIAKVSGAPGASAGVIGYLIFSLEGTCDILTI